MEPKKSKIRSVVGALWSQSLASFVVEFVSGIFATIWFKLSLSHKSKK